VGCRIDATDTFQDAKNIKLEIYENGHSKFEKKIEKDSDIYQWVYHWLERNDTGWSQSFASYLNQCVVSGDDFHLNFLNETATISFKDKNGKQRQLVKTINSREYQFLLDQSGISIR
jgi:hypothetical protein